MILFVRNIPKNTSSAELREFVEPTLKGRFFFSKNAGRIIKTEILLIQDKSKKLSEYHGLIYLDSDTALKHALRKLRGKPFKNRRLLLREYNLRSWRNDQRLNRQIPKEIADRRLYDRRRGDNIEIYVNPANMFVGQDSFARKLINL